jgi:hypothetical protein
LIRALYTIVGLFLLYLLGCTLGKDPGDGVSHIHLWGLIFDITFGPVTTIIVSCIMAPIIVKLVYRRIDKGDKEKMDALKLAEELQQKRHDDTQKLIMENREKVADKLDRICDRFDVIDQRFHDHEHVVQINGALYKSSGKITGGV